MIAITGALLLIAALAGLVLAVVAIRVEDRRASIRERTPSGRIVAACRRVTGLYVRGLPGADDTDKQNSNKKEVRV